MSGGIVHGRSSTDQNFCRRALSRRVIKTAECSGVDQADRELLLSLTQYADGHALHHIHRFEVNQQLAELTDVPLAQLAFFVGRIFERTDECGGNIIHHLGGSVFGFDGFYSRKKYQHPLSEYPDRDTCVYIMENDFHAKVGISNNPEKRRRQLSTASSTPIKIAFRQRSSRKICQEVEKLIHRQFSESRLNGEWFNLPAYSLVYSVRDTFAEVRRKAFESIT